MNAAHQQEMHYYPQEKLKLVNDVPGARQWAVALERAMLTYFEVDPHCRFESHAHESEQITMVIEGVLFFEQGNTVIGVKAGEAIAIPSNAPHAVFTTDAPGKGRRRLVSRDGQIPDLRGRVNGRASDAAPVRHRLNRCTSPLSASARTQKPRTRYEPCTRDGAFRFAILIAGSERRSLYPAPAVSGRWTGGTC